MKDKPNNSFTAPYEYYLADLIKVFDSLGEPDTKATAGRLISRNRNAPVLLTPPPIPPIFADIQDDAATNIRGAVKIYYAYLKPLGNEELAKRAKELYAMAQETTKNWGEDEKSLGSVEKHLTTTMLANRRKTLQDNAHLNFFLLMLIQVGILYRILSSNETKDTTHICYEIDRSYERGVREYNEMRIALDMYELRGIEETEKQTNRHKEISGLGGSKTFEENYGAAQDYALRRYAELSAEADKAGKKRYKKDIAEIILAELKKECGTTLAADCPDFRVLYERWLPKKVKNKTHATS